MRAVLRLAAGVLHGELEDVEPVAVEDRGERDLAPPARAVLGEDRADGLVLARVAARRFERRGDILERDGDAERDGEQPAEIQRLRRRVALGHEEPEHLVRAEGAHAERRDDGAVDAARANTFLAGHRIRVEITSSSFPKYARNLNTGGRNEFEAEGIIATNTVRHARSEASYIVLPILK